METKYPKSNAVRGIIGSLLVSVVVLVALLFTGCATGSQQLHGDVPVGNATPLVEGPARGHWAEQDEHAVVVYVVQGSDCTHLFTQNEAQFETHGTFVLAKGQTLCVMPLRAKQRVLFHATR